MLTFLNRTAACYAVLLMALCSGCASAVDVEPDPLETGTATCEYEGDLRPALDESAATFGELYRDPLRHALQISAALPEANQAAAVAAVGAWREFSGGWIDLTPVIADTACDAEWAVHGAPQGECHLTGSAKAGWSVGWFQTSPFRVTVRTTTAEGGVPSAAETYATTLHELGHALGLPHGGGDQIMNPKLQVQMRSPVLTAEAASTIAKRKDWPAAEFEPGLYDYVP